MASKLTLRFKQPGVLNESIAIRSGIAYFFKNQANGLRRVSIYDPITGFQTAYGVARNFYEAYQTFDNTPKVSTVDFKTTTKDENGLDLPEGTLHYLVTIENIDNNYFNGLTNNTSFIYTEVTTTAQEAESTLDISISEADSDPCNNYKLTISTNQTSGSVFVKSPSYIAGSTLNFTPDGNDYVVDLPRPADGITGSVILYKDGSTQVEKFVLFNPPPKLSIFDIEVEGTPFGAIATINATSKLNLQYSLDNVDFQDSKTIGNLLAGNFTAYVKDPYGCTKSKTFIVTEDQTSGLTVEKKIKVPKHNSLNFADRSQDNFLGHISQEIEGYAKIHAPQDYLKIDAPPIQFKSSYPAHTVKMYGCDFQEEITLIKKSSNINRVNIYEGNYKDIDGRLAIYFTTGNIYNADGSTQDQGHILNGNLPLWYEAGMYLQIEGIGVTKIDRILYDEAGIDYAITELDGVGTLLSKKITSIHTEHPYEIYEFSVDCNQAEGNYIIEINYGEGKYLSEVIRVNESLPKGYYKVSWRNTKKNDEINYSTGILPFRRLKYSRPFTYVGQNEGEVYKADETIELINSTSRAVYEMDLSFMDMEQSRGVCQGINHASEVIVNGAAFVRNNPSVPDSKGNWYTVKNELALIGSTVESLEKDFTEINSDFVKNVEFIKVSDDGFLQL